MSDDLSGFSMMELFRQEVELHLDALNEGLLQLEERGEVEIEPLMRAAHSLKGAGRIVDLDVVVEIAHALEDCFVAAQKGQIAEIAAHVDSLLRGVDLIAQVGRQDDAELPGWLVAEAGRIEALQRELRAVLDPSAHPAPTAPEAETAPQPEAGSKAPEPTPAADPGAVSLFDLFREEVESHRSVLVEGLLELESRGSGEIEPLMRAAHSLKGAARIVDLEAVVRLAHLLEDAFVAAQDGKLDGLAEHADVLLRSVDLVGELSALEEAKLSGWLVAQAARIEALQQELRALVDPEARPVKAPTAKPSPPPPPPPDPAPAASPRLEARDLRIRAESLTRLMGLAGESVVAAGWLEPFTDSLVELKRAQDELGDLLEELAESARAGRSATGTLDRAKEALRGCRRILAERMQHLEAYGRRSGHLSSRLYREVLSGRMRPFADGVKGFPRMVRDVARELGKKVRLEILGKETEVDRDILDQLEAPLNHILRNAVDHGIETVEERERIGKEPMATIQLEARHQGGKLLVTVGDDGQGIDLGGVRARILERELAPPELLEGMSQEEILNFLFLPGFSTAAKVTQISGRGVGLDVVQSMVQGVGGSLHVDTRAGRGTTFFLRLPVTRSVIRVLLVEVADEPFAIPLAAVDRILRVPRAAVGVLEDRQFFDLEGENVGLVAARQVLGLASAPSSERVVSVVVLGDYQERYGIVVDRFLGEREVVVQSLDTRLGKVPDIAAAALMENGSPVLILDPEDMVRSIDALLGGERVARVTTSGAVARKRVLVVDDSVTMREVERRLLENRGYLVDAAVDGADGWNALRGGEYDLLVTDVDMPRMNGFDLVTKVRSEPRLAKLPVIMVSYKEREEDRQRGVEVGADVYLTKANLHDRTILDAVQRLIGEAAG